MRDEGGGMRGNSGTRRRALLHPSHCRPHPFLVAFALLVVFGGFAFFFVAPALVERHFNGTRQSPPYQASERARRLHRTLLVADLHADSLLWDRDLLERAGRGHVDVPRLAERWPPPAWRSLKERALYQARKLDDAAARSGGRFVVIRTRGDLDAFLERRKREPQLVAGLLGVEGAHALDGDVANVDVFFDAGFRMMAPTHFFDNE